MFNALNHAGVMVGGAEQLEARRARSRHALADGGVGMERGQRVRVDVAGESRRTDVFGVVALHGSPSVGKPRVPKAVRGRRLRAGGGVLRGRLGAGAGGRRARLLRRVFPRAPRSWRESSTLASDFANFCEFCTVFGRTILRGHIFTPSDLRRCGVRYPPCGDLASENRAILRFFGKS